MPRSTCLVFFCGMMALSPLFADSTEGNFTPNIPSVPGATSGGPGGMPNSFGPPGESMPGSPGSQGAVGGAGFSQFLQQQTATALQSFKNVTYQHLSTAENQNDFGDGSSNTVSPPTSFNVFEAQS